MPETKTGFTVDDKPMFTPEQWAKIKELLAAGKEAEAQKMINDILDAKDAAAK